MQRQESIQEASNKEATEKKKKNGLITDFLSPEMLLNVFDKNGRLKNKKFFKTIKININGEQKTAEELLEDIPYQDRGFTVFEPQIIKEIQQTLESFQIQITDSNNNKILDALKQIKKITNDPHTIPGALNNVKPDYYKISESVQAIQNIIATLSEELKSKENIDTYNQGKAKASRTPEEINLGRIFDIQKSVEGIPQQISTFKAQQSALAAKAVSVINPILGALQSVGLIGTKLQDKVLTATRKKAVGDSNNKIVKYVQKKVGSVIVKHVKYSSGQKLALVKKELVKDNFTIADIANLFEVKDGKLELKADIKEIINPVDFQKQEAKQEEMKVEIQVTKNAMNCNIQSTNIVQPTPQNMKKQQTSNNTFMNFVDKNFKIVNQAIEKEVNMQVKLHKEGLEIIKGDLSKGWEKITDTTKKVFGQKTTEELNNEKERNQILQKNQIYNERFYKENNIESAQVEFLKEIEKIGELLTKELQHKAKLNNGLQDGDFNAQFHKLQKNWYDFKCLDKQQNDVVKLFKAAMSTFTKELITIVRVTKELLTSLCGDKNIDLPLNSDEALDKLMTGLKLTDPFTYGVISKQIKEKAEQGKDTNSI